MIITIYVFKLNYDIKHLKIEKMGNTATDSEALGNLASMYKDGVLKVTSLEVTKDINCKGNGYFGPAYIGHGDKVHSDYAMFGHKDNASWKNYALMQHNNGHTFVNGGRNGNIYFRTNNANEALMHKGTMTLSNANVKNKITVNELNVNRTHFNYQNKGINYIRGTTVLDGALNLNGKLDVNGTVKAKRYKFVDGNTNKLSPWSFYVHSNVGHFRSNSGAVFLFNPGVDRRFE